MSRLRTVLSLILLPAILSPVCGSVTAPAPTTLIVCAPGYPGTTILAQPRMDRFAREIAASAGRSEESVRAVYFETVQGGLGHMKKVDAALALVPLSFYMTYGDELKLSPKLQVIRGDWATEVWSLVAHRGSLQDPEALAGWEVTGRPGHAPQFVREILLGGWGEVPEEARITFTSAVLSALRRAAAGQKTAVLLDRAQSEALSAMPFADALEIVHQTRPLPGHLACTIGDRPHPENLDEIIEALLRLHTRPGGEEILEALRMTRFVVVDAEAFSELGHPIATPREAGP